MWPFHFTNVNSTIFRKGIFRGRRECCGWLGRPDWRHWGGERNQRGQWSRHSQTGPEGWDVWETRVLGLNPIQPELVRVAWDLSHLGHAVSCYFRVLLSIFYINHQSTTARADDPDMLTPINWQHILMSGCPGPSDMTQLRKWNVFDDFESSNGKGWKRGNWPPR